ncbi:MAG: flagellar type III secretion system pore protein FliP [Spirochaetales bacterium]|nr:flagellar type III secretion system pore protein FliP [Spirochaetales bacterium]
MSKLSKKIILAVGLLTLIMAVPLFAQAAGGMQIPIPSVNVQVGEAQTPNQVALSLQLLFLLSILTLAPSIMVLMTSFLRIAIVFDFVKKALSLQQMPPNQVMFGLALFMTFFIMQPTFDRINKEAIQPYFNQESVAPEQRLNTTQFFQRSVDPLRDFMFRQTEEQYIGFFMNMRGLPPPATYSDVPTYVLIPAFVINEMTVGFKIGVLLFIPFLIIDMVVASILMAMGMVMLPPVMITLPFKILLFVLVDGWELLTYELFRSFG